MAKFEGWTTIRVSKNVARELQKLGTMDEDYEIVIRRLLHEHRQIKVIARSASDAKT